MTAVKFEQAVAHAPGPASACTPRPAPTRAMARGSLPVSGMDSATQLVVCFAIPAPGGGGLGAARPGAERNLS